MKIKNIQVIYFFICDLLISIFEIQVRNGKTDIQYFK